MYMAADGSLYAPDPDPRAAGSSRTPSPSPRSVPRRLGDSSVSSLDDEITPIPQNGKLSYAQQQPQHNQSLYLTPSNNNSRQLLSPQPESFYSGAVQPGGQYYDPYTPTANTQVHSLTPQIHEQPPTPRAPGGLAARSALHGPRAPISHSRTPSPDIGLQGQLRELRSPVTVAAGAIGIGPGIINSSVASGDETLRTRFRGLEVGTGGGGGVTVTSPPPGFPPQQQPSHRGALPLPGQPQPSSQQYRRGSGAEGEHPADAALVPSAKALGKRRAVEKLVDCKFKSHSFSHLLFVTHATL